jgi:hypothetical protein
VLCQTLLHDSQLLGFVQGAVHAFNASELLLQTPFTSCDVHYLATDPKNGILVYWRFSQWQMAQSAMLCSPMSDISSLKHQHQQQPQPQQL